MNGRLLLHQLRQLVVEGEGQDALLLEQFVQNQDEIAFARLLEQNGPMVWGVCRRVLRDVHLAEDAFQATFLVLLRRAGSITSRERLAGWLHGVAYRVALKARAQAARQQARQRELQERAAVNDQTPGRDDVSAVLDEEVQKLPARYREPIVLCYFEGKSGVEVARSLGLPEGTVHAWLTRAREQLRTRLVRRGLALSTASLAALLEANLSAAVPPRVLENTLLTARQTLAAGHPPANVASALADATIKEQFMSKLKFAMAILALGAALIGTGLLAMQKDYSPKEKITGKSAAQLPRAAGYQAELCRWLETMKIEDVTFQPGPLSYDGAFTDTTELANLWVELRGARTYLDPGGESGCKVLSAEPRWFILDDGKQGGIEGTGTVRLFTGAVLGAYWYQRSLPLADGKQGNPGYHHAALGRRALVCAAVDMLMQDLDHEHNDYNRRSDFLGGQLNAWAYTYGECKSTIDAKGRAAFEAGFARLLDKISGWGPRDVNTNMDIRVISSMAYVYRATDNQELKDKAVRIARRFLFGRDDGTLATLDSSFRKGLFRPAGYIAENQGAETTYNGVSLFHIVEARAVTLGDRNWDFLDEVVRRMLDFKLHQYFRDPDGRCDGPSGYANRTGNSYVYDQRDRSWRDATASATYVEGRPLARSLKLGGAHILPEPAEMVRDIREAVNGFNSRGFGKTSDATPPAWTHQHWPPDTPYSAGPGWYESLRKLKQANDPSFLTPFERPAAFNRGFDNEFWVYKNNDGGRDFGFFIETLPGTCYGPWVGGSLQAFWTKTTGLLILACHDKGGDEFDKHENTRVWSEIDKWGTHHVWGRDAANIAVSNAVDMTDNKVTHQLEGKPPFVEVVSQLYRGPVDAKASTEGTLIADTSVTTRFQALADGLQVRQTVEPGKAGLKELWSTLPVFLRNAEAQAKLKDATIEHWNGSAWLPLGTELVSTAKLRLGRDFGSGPQYGYVHFEQPRRVKLSGDVWQAAYQSRNRVRNVHIDLHGDPGKLQTPAVQEIAFRITTKE